ncbi:DgyrCDS3093 [Dimorphilus gyrociliatus]|nr:DgyrCDS3093 [Dimorphilus gyrociliatus]
MSICSDRMVHILSTIALTINIFLIQMADGKCNKEQAEFCRNAARNNLEGGSRVTENSLHAISPGGKCDIQSYADGLYTHECRVASYKPQIDYCCCQFKKKAMCCLYHQTWDRFRCNEKEDVIDTFPWKYNGHYGSNGPYKMSLPLLVALPISALLLLLCIGASVYYYRKKKKAKRYEKDSESWCSCSKCYEESDTADDEDDKDDYSNVRKTAPSPEIDRRCSGPVGLLGFPLHTFEEQYPGPPQRRNDDNEFFPVRPTAPPFEPDFQNDNLKEGFPSNMCEGENVQYVAESFRGLLPPPLYEEVRHHRTAPEC